MAARHSVVFPAFLKPTPMTGSLQTLNGRVSPVGTPTRMRAVESAVSAICARNRAVDSAVRTELSLVPAQVHCPLCAVSSSPGWHYVSSHRFHGSNRYVVDDRSVLFAGRRTSCDPTDTCPANAGRHRRDAEPVHALDRALPGNELVAFGERADDAGRLCDADAQLELQQRVCEYPAAGTESVRGISG